VKRALLVLLAACPSPKTKPPAPLADPAGLGDRDTNADLIAELQDDILKSYERDEPPDYDNAMVPPEVGTIRIGVGPGDVLIDSELARAPSRWPLDVDPSSPAEPRSKRLEIHLSADRQAAWANDEISWRIKMCDRTAVIPLRMSALYARDGDRWVPVFEHLSFARPSVAGEKPPREIRTAVSSRDLADELSRVLSPVLRRALDKSPNVLAGDVALFGPDVSAEWHGEEATGARLMAGSEPMKLEDRRVGVVGRNARTANLAYWVGNLTADLPARPGLPAGKGYFRASFVFEKQQNQWVIVQGHVSQPIDDDNLGFAVFGTALISPKPLAISCDDGSHPPAKKR
jgi:hypothetical protein